MPGRLGSIARSTQSTAMGDSRDEYWDTTLLLREVLAALMSDSLSDKSTGIAMLVRICVGMGEEMCDNQGVMKQKGGRRQDLCVEDVETKQVQKESRCTAYPAFPTDRDIYTAIAPRWLCWRPWQRHQKQ